MSNSHWIRFGKVDPYFGVCASDKFHGSLSLEARAEFFQSGEQHVSEVFSHFSGFHPARSLDFGCGVGRLTIPIAQRSAATLGIDVSPGMLLEADRNCSHLVNVKLSTEIEGQFDFVHSFIVFQHIPAKQGYVLIEQILDALLPGGCGMLHLCFASKYSSVVQAILRNKLAGTAVNAWRGRPLNYPRMHMHPYDLSRVVSMLVERRCFDIHLDIPIDDPDVFMGAKIYFRKN